MSWPEKHMQQNQLAQYVKREMRVKSGCFSLSACEVKFGPTKATWPLFVSASAFAQGFLRQWLIRPHLMALISCFTHAALPPFTSFLQFFLNMEKRKKKRTLGKAHLHFRTEMWWEVCYESHPRLIILPKIISKQRKRPENNVKRPQEAGKVDWNDLWVSQIEVRS